MKAPDDVYIELSAEVVSTVLDDEYMLLNVETGRYFGLNGVASEITRIVESADAPLNSEAIVEQLSQKYPNVDKDRLAQDTVTFAADMEERGLFVIKSQSSTSN